MHAPCRYRRCGSRARDRANATLTLARHRLCAKSLYCGWQGGTRLFGSEPPALRAHPAFQAPAHCGALALLRRALTRPSAGLAAYSNRAGSHAERFIVADGRSFQGADGSFVEGASFAVPRVSDYAVFLRQKFPNLNAPPTASIILDTAQWQSAWGEKNGANQAVYGQGEASLAHALAPVGALR